MVRSILCFVCLSWNKGVIEQVVLESEVRVGVSKLLSLSMFVSAATVVGFAGWTNNLWDEIVVDFRPEWVGSGKWISGLVAVELNVGVVIIHIVSVVASVGTEVVINVGMIVLVSVALRVGLYGFDVEDWGLILRWTDVLNFSVLDGWLVNRVGVWLWCWVVHFWDGVLPQGSLILSVMVIR